MKKTAIWLLTAIAILPFIYSPFILGAYTTPKSILLRGIAFFVFLLTLGILFANKKDAETIYLKIKAFFRDPLALSIVANTILLGISTLCAFQPKVAFFGELQRTEGFITLFALVCIFFGFKLYFEKPEWDRFFTLTAYTPFILLIIQLINMGKGIARPDALSGNPTFLAGYYLFTLFIGLELVRQGLETSRSSRIWLGGLSVAATLMGIMLTGTRGALFGVILGCIICAVICVIKGGSVKTGRYTLRSLSASFLVACAILGTILGLSWKAAFWQKVPGINRAVQTSFQEANTNSRFMFAKQSIQYFVKEKNIARVLVGWGWDNYTFFWTKHYNPKTFFYDPSIADRAHNKLIDELIMTGLLGLISYLAIWYFFIRRIWQVSTQKFTTSLPYILLASSYFVFLITTFDMPMILVYFYASLAYLDTMTTH